MKIFLFLLSLVSLNIQAKDFVWLSAGAGGSSFSNVSPGSADALSFGQTYYAEFDGARFPLVIGHYAYRLTKSSDVEIKPDTEADFKLKQHELGGKLMIPWDWWDFYVGAGFLWGRASLENLSDGNGADKSRSAGGYYWHTGFDWLFNPYVGIRFSYQSNHVRIDHMKNLNDKRLNFDYSNFLVGIVIRGFK